MEGWIAVKEFGDCANAMIEEFLFKSNQFAFNIVDTAHAVNAQVRFEVETSEPRPGSALVLGQVALRLRSNVHGVVAAALW